ncbi:MAG: DUF1902 domain-containing protein [Caulobacteraceae bacterium]
MNAAYYLWAIWDEEAAVWISESDIPGLVIETETLGEFEALVGHLAPEMLAINENIPPRLGAGPVHRDQAPGIRSRLELLADPQLMDHATAAPYNRSYSARRMPAVAPQMKRSSQVMP